MIITLKPGADVERVSANLAGKGLWVSSVLRAARTSASVGDSGANTQLVVSPSSLGVSAEELADVEGVLAIFEAPSPHPRVDAQKGATVCGIGGDEAVAVVIAGPCCAESKEQVDTIAGRIAKAGAQFLRGGAFKPRSSPYAFQGHGPEGLRWLRDAADQHRLSLVTEAVGEKDVSAVAEVADMIQVGSRNMQNFALLKTIGLARKPVMLKRAMSATIEEWLLAGEYLLNHGASGVVYCERGIRGFDNRTRNLLDLGAVALLAHVYRLPIIVDPSHAVGRRDLVLPLSKAALAVGASGVMVETHHQPECALSDGPQAIVPEAVETIVDFANGRVK